MRGYGMPRFILFPFADLSLSPLPSAPTLLETCTIRRWATTTGEPGVSRAGDLEHRMAQGGQDRVVWVKTATRFAKTNVISIMSMQIVNSQCLHLHSEGIQLGWYMETPLTFNFRFTSHIANNSTSSYASGLATDNSELDLVILPALQDQGQDLSQPGRYQDLFVLKTLFQRCKLVLAI